ncbi:MAG: hypothetical protein WA159_14910 [Variovorax sp.]|jgi:DNA polymerase V
MFALFDVNNMYVSCERAFSPRLVGRPVVVLSSNDGACIARSNEAKDLGVGMAEPWFKVKHLEKTAGLIAVSANHELYSDMSARIMAIGSRYASRIEIYSIEPVPKYDIDASQNGFLCRATGLGKNCVVPQP